MYCSDKDSINSGGLRFKGPLPLCPGASFSSSFAASQPLPVEVSPILFCSIFHLSSSTPVCCSGLLLPMQSSGADPSQLWASLPVLRYPPFWGSLLQAHLFPHPSPPFRGQKRTLSLWVFIKFHSLWSVMLLLPARLWLCQASCSSVESLTRSLGSWMPPWARVWPSSPGPEIMFPWDC